MHRAATVPLLLLLCALLAPAAPAGAAEKCKAKVDKKTGVIEVSAAKVDAASFRWGPSSTQAAYAFFDPGCVKGDKATGCTLGDPASIESKIPPAACELYLLDSIAACTVWVPGCVPGVRALDFSFGQIGPDAILDGAITSGKIDAGAVGAVQIENHSIDSNELAFGAVEGSNLAPGAVGASHIGSGQIGGFHMGVGVVGAREIADGSVGAAELADGAIGMAEVELPAGNAGNGVPFIALEAGDNFHYDNAPTFTPTASGRCLVVSTAFVSTGDGPNADEAWVRTAREQDGADAHDGMEGPEFSRIPDDGVGSVTVSAVWDVAAGEPTRFGCFVFVAQSDFVGDALRCRTTYLCQ